LTQIFKSWAATVTAAVEAEGRSDLLIRPFEYVKMFERVVEACETEDLSASMHKRVMSMLPTWGKDKDKKPHLDDDASDEE
jgi:hypothetical protein